MGQAPDRIREEIEQTRAEMGETVDALGYKTDVKARAKESIQDKKDSVVGAARSGKGLAQDNPLGLAVGAAAVGFLAGLLIPATRVEDDKLGAVADDVKDRIKDTGQEALERGKQVAQDAAETAKESGQEHAEGLRDSAQDHAQQVAG